MVQCSFSLSAFCRNGFSLEAGYPHIQGKRGACCDTVTGFLNRLWVTLAHVETEAGCCAAVRGPCVVPVTVWHPGFISFYLIKRHSSGGGGLLHELRGDYCPRVCVLAGGVATIKGAQLDVFGWQPLLMCTNFVILNNVQLMRWFKKTVHRQFLLSLIADCRGSGFSQWFSVRPSVRLFCEARRIFFPLPLQLAASLPVREKSNILDYFLPHQFVWVETDMWWETDVLSRIWTLDVASNYGYNYTVCVLSPETPLRASGCNTVWDNLGKYLEGGK